jgi:hypothetical protein
MSKIPSKIKEGEYHNNTRVISFFKMNRRNPRNNNLVSLRV